MRTILESRSELDAFLTQSAQDANLKTIPKDKKSNEYFEFLARIWLTELSKRRCIWCWNKYENESYALWKLYGSKGVAIRSTVGKVRRALKGSAPFRCLVATVQYAIPRRILFLDERSNMTSSMTCPGFLQRPYVFKEQLGKEMKIGRDFDPPYPKLGGTPFTMADNRGRTL
jgi:hypothetical protein